MTDQKILERQARAVVDLVQRLDREVAAGRPADAWLSQHLRRRRGLGGRDRRLLSETAFSYLRWKGWLGRLEFLGWEAVLALAFLLDADKQSPVISLLAQRGGLADLPLEPLHGRTPLEKGQALFGWLDGKLPGYFPDFAPDLLPLVPSWVPTAVQRPDASDPGHLPRLIAAFQERPPTWLRVKPGYQEAVDVQLRAFGAKSYAHARLPWAIALPGSPDLAPLRSKLSGFFTVQDLASQCVGLVAAPQPGQRWWDACAGAGGKTLHLLELMRDRGNLLSTDLRPGILEQLKARAEEAGCRSLATGVLDAGKDSPADRDFDGVLVDAPCSGLGTWSRNPDARWRTEADDVERKAALQGRILRRVAAKVRPGGTLVYAVCTVTHAETVGVIEAFLHDHDDFALDPVEHPLTGEPTRGTVWIWPWEGPCDGMFIARLKRSP
jgi:16S rRNA (cytosine967-C5)-methyltransferase